MDSQNTLSAGSFKVIYVYTLVDDKGVVLPTHEGRIKVGDATLHTAKTVADLLVEATEVAGAPGLYTSSATDDAARKRIDQQTKTADQNYALLTSFLAVRPTDRGHASFRDYTIHDVLRRSGFKKSFVRKDKRAGEWFEATLQDALGAAQAVVAGRSSVGKSAPVTFELRPEQKEAVRRTSLAFRNGTRDEPKDFLWNAIMRFGKTFTTYRLVEKLEADVKKVLVLTHRPVVVDGWETDFGMVFPEESGWSFASKKRAERWDSVKGQEKFFYFASVQDLRGSFDKANAANEDDTQAEDWTPAELDEVLTKNAEVFDTEWDLIVFDEAHEGLKTQLAERMTDRLSSRYRLRLSGTPFNIIDEYSAEQIYTWSYIDEQKAKEAWENAQEDPDDNRFGEPNPYAALPELELRTYDLDGVFKGHPAIMKDGVYFNFKKFFEVDKEQSRQGDVYASYAPFKNEAMVYRLLDLMTDSKASRGDYDAATGEVRNAIPSSFPYANDRAWTDFADTFWVLPSIDATVALHEILLKHPNFQGVGVVNASGAHDSGDPLGDVHAAIKAHDRTITLSIGKLTTGTTVPEWTAVFMLSNMKSATLYMQTIFRSKSSGSLRDGRSKDKSYVFDFSPERTLEMVADAGRMNALATAKEERLSLNVLEEAEREKAFVEELLSYLPIVAYDGAGFKTADSQFIMRTLNKIYIEQNVRGGFDSMKLYNREALKKLSLDDLGVFSELAANVVKATADNEVRKVTINSNDLHESQMTAPEARELEKKPKKELSDEEREALEAYRRLNDQVRNLMLTLKGVSVRLPLMVLGAPTHDPKTGELLHLTVDNFTEVVDDESWVEFMPQGFKKYGTEEPSWEFLKPYYDRSIFEGSVQALQDKVHEAFDPELPILDRVTRLAYLLSTFKNPDKETVLTPWKVVNLQCANTLGGLRWVNDEGLARVKDIRTGEIVYASLEDTVENPEWYRAEPEWVTSDVDPVERDGQDFWEDRSTTIFDINSKTALYPLYAAASLLYAQKLWNEGQYIGRRVKNVYEGKTKDEKLAEDLRMWKDIVEKQIFVNCRVPYSRKIAERILRGYDEQVEVNASVVDVLTVRSKLKELGFYSESQAPKARKNESAEDLEARIDSWSASNPASQLDRVWQWLFNTEWSHGSPIEHKEHGKIEMTPTERAKSIMAAKSSDDVLAEISGAEVSKGFTAIVSNPPYQIEVPGAIYSTSVYQYFFEVSQSITQRFVSFIHPSRWMQGGKGIDAHYRQRELMSTHYSRFYDFSDSSSLFPSVGISGGICIYLWDKEKISPGLIFSFNGKESKRPSLSSTGLLIRDPDASKLFSKIDTKYTISAQIGPVQQYGRAVLNLKEIEKNATKQSENSSIVLYPGKPGHIGRKRILDSLLRETSTHYKVVISRTSHGISKDKYPRPDRIFLSKPGEVLSGSFLQAGKHTTQVESLRMLQYLKTDFCNFLLALMTPVQVITAGSFILVPDVSFDTGEILDKPGFFLDFTKPETLDDQLSEIYGLTNDERALMTKDLKPWKNKIDVEADR